MININRNLYGMYFRVKRDDTYQNICFSDLTPEEREDICRGRSAQWLKTVLYHITDCLKAIGDQLDICGE